MIAISGKERSGTTWLEMLLRHNYINGGIDAKHKHRFTGVLRSAEIMTLVISKHPLDWFYSYYKYIRKSGVSFRDFGDKSVNQIAIWSDFYFHWLDWSLSAEVKFIRYIDLLADPEKVLSSTGLLRYDEPFNPVRNTVCADGTVLVDEFYEREEPSKAYAGCSGLIDDIRELVSEEVVKALGYDNELK